MSTPNPTHIIAEGMREVATEGQKGTPGTRDDGQLWGAFPNTMTLKDLAAHVVSKLMDAGYGIMPNAVLTELVDPDKCSFDHNGGCQAHGHFPPDDQAWTCPVEDAKNILAAAAEEGQ